MGIGQTMEKEAKVGSGSGKTLQGGKRQFQWLPNKTIMGWGTSPVATSGKDKWKNEERIGWPTSKVRRMIMNL